MEGDWLETEAVLSEWMIKDGWTIGQNLLLFDDLDGRAVCELLAILSEGLVVQHSLTNRKQLVK